jgi:RAD50-interacting protein 1
MQRLHKLDVAAGYVELLKEVDSLQSECVLHLGTSDEAALAPYKRLQRLVACLSPLQEAAEGAAPHLLDHIARQVQQLRQTIQDSFAGDLEKTLGKMNWPKPLETVPMALQEEWSRNVRRLLDLQRQDLEDYEHNVGRQSSGSEPPPLLPLEVMVRPLEQRFTYHFSGNKPTNRLDKPEYFMSHTTDLISSYSGFLDNAVQPLLLQYFRGSDLAFTPAYIDANSAFITALLPMLKRKLLGFASQASKQPQLLSHLVHEVMSFDTTIQESFGYSPVSPSVPWRGLAYFLLDTCGYFEQWLAVERDFALSRYQSIVDSPESHELDYDSVASDATKPTKAAIRVNDLVDTITERYRASARSYVSLLTFKSPSSTSSSSGYEQATKLSLFRHPPLADGCKAYPRKARLSSKVSKVLTIYAVSLGLLITLSMLCGIGAMMCSSSSCGRSCRIVHAIENE